MVNDVRVLKANINSTYVLQVELTQRVQPMDRGGKGRKTVSVRSGVERTGRLKLF